MTRAGYAVLQSLCLDSRPVFSDMVAVFSSFMHMFLLGKIIIKKKVHLSVRKK